jgi:hypothetical protein
MHSIGGRPPSFGST